MLRARIEAGRTRDAMVINEESLHISIPFTEQEKALFGPTGVMDPSWEIVADLAPARKITESPLLFTISDSELVGNTQRQVLELPEFWYVYIPLNQNEVEELNCFRMARDMVNPAFRLRIDKYIPENRIPMLEQNNRELVAALQSLFQQCSYMGAPLDHADMKAASDAIEHATGKKPEA